MLSQAHNVNLGGVGLVIYRLSESCPVSGILVDDAFYPGQSGHFKDPMIHLAFFALNHQKKTDAKILAKAVDVAGNTSKIGFYHHIRKKRFKEDKINISDRFLQRKLPEFGSLLPEKNNFSEIEKFLWINSELRKATYDKVVEICSKSDTVMHWEGAFLRLPNSKRMAGYADSRDYLFGGQVVDHQFHLGIDLAGYGNDVVPAANNGRVVFRDYLGVYGKTVIIDHGFGLFSLYSHLSQLSVDDGQFVNKGEPIGRTGMTGLAGGDHLHFGMFVHNTYVNPVEWWDLHWIQDNVTSKIEAIAPGA